MGIKLEATEAEQRKQQNSRILGKQQYILIKNSGFYFEILPHNVFQ